MKFIKVLGVLAIAFVISIAQGALLALLWQWFVVEQFHVPPLGVAQAIGLSITVSMLVHVATPDNSEKPWYAVAATSALRLLVTWGLAAVVHAFC